MDRRDFLKTLAVTGAVMTVQRSKQWTYWRKN